MARLIPTILVFFHLSILLSSSQARSLTTSLEDDVVSLPQPVSDQQDVSDDKPVILLPTDKVLESGKVSEEVKEKGMPTLGSVDDGGKRIEKEFVGRVHWRPIHHCRHRGPRFDGGAQIRPRMPFWREEKDVVEENEHQRHQDRLGEMFSARWIDGPRFHQMDIPRFPDVGGDGKMIGEFKQPHFFFHHHHHHHRHHDDDVDRYHGDEDQVNPARFPDVDGDRMMIGEFKQPHFFFPRHHHHHHHHHDDDVDHYHGDEEEMHHHGHGLWKTIRKFLPHF